MDWKLFLQIAGIILGLLYLYLEYKADIRLWIVGIIMPVVHGVLYYKSGLYADMGMNVYYVLAGLYGWIVWHNEPHEPDRKRTVSRTPAKTLLPLIAIFCAIFIAISYILITFTDSKVPYCDAFTTALSIVAMWMLSRKYLEQWLVWLVVDIVTCGLYIYKGIPFTTGLYGIYSVLAIVGYFRWRRLMCADLMARQ